MSLVFLVHGYSIWKTQTYGQLPEVLRLAGHQTTEIFLGRYISLDDNVQIRDIAQAMDIALREKLPQGGGEFHIITHSTGALVTKHWISEFYGKGIGQWKLGNLIFLAGPHFGSRLAHHGRSLLNEIIKMGDPGREVLRSLELGSEYSWEINRMWAKNDAYRGLGVRPYNVIGDKVRRDILRNVELAREPGSDQVVRASAGNLNFKHFKFDLTSKQPFSLQPDYEINGVPFAVLANYTHSGASTPLLAGYDSILDSITVPSALPAAGPAAVFVDDKLLNVQVILSLLSVSNASEYAQQYARLEQLTYGGQARAVTRFAQLQFRVRDKQGMPVPDPYIEFSELSQNRYMPTRAIVHTHKNEQCNNIITFFVDTTQLKAPGYQFRIVVHTGSPLVYYEPCVEDDDVGGIKLYHGEKSGALNAVEAIGDVGSIVQPNMTTQIDVIFDRKPLTWLFRFDNADGATGIDPTGKPINTPLTYPVAWDRWGRIWKI